MSKSKKIEVDKITTPTTSRFAAESTAKSVKVEDNLIFGKKNYIYMLAGVALIIFGFMLMSGGHMPSSDVWDESLIYSPRRTMVAPMLILLGLALQFVAIFSKRN